MSTLVNNTKTAILLAALFALLVWVGSFWGSEGMIVAGVFATLLNFGAYFFSDKIAIAAMRAQEVDSRRGGELYEMVARLAQRANLPMPRVYVCPQEAPNAFATGRNPRHAAVAVTQGALRLLDRDELEGVLAHELAHIRNRDTLISTVAATVAGVFSMLGNMYFFMGPGNREGSHPVAGLIMIVFAPLAAMLIKMAISRSREYVADANGAQIAGSPHGLASALRKLDSVARRVPLQNPNPAMNNLFIVEPFIGGLTNLFATHPPIEKRIAALLSR